MSQKAHLVGHLKPTANPEGFVLPVFQIAGANGLSVQIIDKDGAVAGFEQIFPQELISEQQESLHSVVTGQAAIWGFADKSGKPRFEPRSTLQVHLRAKLAETRDPFLQLQIARFCNAETELASAWQAAYDRLKEYSPRSALAWRDMVVLPPAIRAAVIEIAQEHGITEEASYWDHAVETLTRDNRLHIGLRQPIYHLFQGNEIARSQLERQTAPVRKAFGIQVGSLKLTELVHELTDQSTPAPSETPSENLIVALGGMAENLVCAVLPAPLERVSERRREPMPIGYHPSEPVLLIRGREIVNQTRLSEDFSSIPIGTPEELIIIFQLGEGHSRLWEAACGLAEEQRKRGGRAIAIIPHLPDYLFDGIDETSEMPARLSSAFHQIWFLSDRSPDVRRRLPYGPARSTLAVARHLRFVLHDGFSWLNMNKPVASIPGSAEVAIVGSANGDQMLPSLLEHAAMRLIHPEIDMITAHEALISVLGSPGGPPEITKTFSNREFPNAMVQVDNRTKRDGGYNEVVVAAQGVTMRRVAGRHFEDMCANQLDKAGWIVSPQDQDTYDFAVSRGKTHLQIECKFDSDGSGSRGYKALVGKKWRNDIVVITTKTLRKKQFLQHVLNGQTTLHYSRIAVLNLIHGRRFNYVMTALRNQKIDIKKDVLPACLNWLSAQQQVTDLLSVPARAELADHGQMEHLIGGTIHRFLLPVKFRPARSSDSGTPMFALAHIMLDEHGWRLLSLEPR